MEASNLFPSQALKGELERYATLIPPTQEAFIQHFERVWPGKKDVPLCSDDASVSCCDDQRFGCGWYNANYPSWNEQVALETASALNDIIVTYWGSQVSCTSAAQCLHLVPCISDHLSSSFPLRISPQIHRHPSQLLSHPQVQLHHRLRSQLRLRLLHFRHHHSCLCARILNLSIGAETGAHMTVV